ncbi:hypothetical protein [Streptomyces eurythermus]
MKIGSWPRRRLATWQTLQPGRQQLVTNLGPTPDTHPLPPPTEPAAPSPRPSGS